VHKKKKVTQVSKGTIISIATISSVSILIGFLVLNSFSPVNSDKLIFETPTNILLKAVKSLEGNYHYMASTKGGKTVPNVAGDSPPLMVTNGNLVQIHLINEEKNEPSNKSIHNLNIDEFNVHTGDLGYFQTKSITFLADKVGTFEYYCSIHPEMKGTITVK